MFRARKVTRGHDCLAQSADADLDCVKGQKRFTSPMIIKRKSVKIVEPSRVLSPSQPMFADFAAKTSRVLSPSQSNLNDESLSSKRKKRKSMDVAAETSRASSPFHAKFAPNRSKEGVGVNLNDESFSSKRKKKKSMDVAAETSRVSSPSHAKFAPNRSKEAVGVNLNDEFLSSKGKNKKSINVVGSSTVSSPSNSKVALSLSEELENEEDEESFMSFSSDDMNNDSMNNDNSSSSISSVDREFEIVDSQGVSTKKKERFSSKHVYGLPPGSKVVVRLNEENQPIKRGGLILRRFIGRTVRKEKIVGIAYKTWKHLEAERKKQIVKYIRAKFHIQEGTHIDRIILMHCNNKWRSYKCNLKKKVTKNGEYSKEVAYDNRPSRIDADVWVKIVDRWYSEEFKMISKEAKISRSAKMHVHTTGAKSFAEKRDELEEKHDREIGPVEFFKECHITKDGSYFDHMSGKYVEQATEYVNEKAGSSIFSESTINLEYEAHYQLRGPDKGRVKGYGLGVMPSQFRGGRSNRKENARNEDVIGLQNEVKRLQEQSALQMSIIANMKAQLDALSNLANSS